MIRKLFTVLTLIPVLIFSTTRGVFGVEIVISGNSNENNEITVQSTSTTSVQQNNTATINNEVQVTADTGNNDASNNSGDVTIQTGNVETSVDVVNTANTSQATVGCCENNQTNTIVINGNANNGTNTVSVNSANTNTVVVNQTANISNIVQGTANTGHNKAKFNTGNTTITTGWIKHTDEIVNKDVNVSNVLVQTYNPEWFVQIAGNSNGNNTVILAVRNDAITTIYNNANLYNTSLWNLTTGDNSGKGNNGDVVIITGDIKSSTSIKNDGINVNTVKVDCCTKDQTVDPEDEDPVIPPSDPPKGGSDKPKIDNGNGNGGQSGNGSAGGSSLGSVLGAILPATGADFWLFATIANILMFLLGLYLRLRAGRSPCYAYATR